MFVDSACLKPKFFSGRTDAAKLQYRITIFLCGIQGYTGHDTTMEHLTFFTLSRKYI